MKEMWVFIVFLQLFYRFENFQNKRFKKMQKRWWSTIVNIVDRSNKIRLGEWPLAFAIWWSLVI